LKLRTFRYFFREAGHSLARNGWMSLAAMGTITIALILFGGFYLITTNLQHFGQLALGRIEIRVFLDDSVQNNQGIEEKLAAISGVEKVEFVSKEEGARSLERMLGGGDLFREGENPLPDSFNIHPAAGADVERIALQAQGITGIDEVVYGQNFVKFLNVAVRMVWIAGLGLLFLVVLAVLYIVVNTIQMTVYARRKEIEIMKLVGATDWFVRWPFLLEGILLGLGGAIISAVVLLEGYTFIHNRLREVSAVFTLLTRTEITPYLIGGFFIMGIFFGAWGSLLSVKKYLDV